MADNNRFKTLPFPDHGSFRTSKLIHKMTKTVGEGNWYFAYRASKRLFEYKLGLSFYEDAFWLAIRDRPSLLRKLVGATDIICHGTSNGEYCRDYRPCLNSASFSDVAVRRALTRMGLRFRGGAGGERVDLADLGLDDGHVKFHLPHLLAQDQDDQPEGTARHWLFANRVAVIATTTQAQVGLAEVLVRM